MYIFKYRTMEISYLFFIISLIVCTSAFPESRNSKRNPYLTYFKKPANLFQHRRNYRVDSDLSPPCPETEDGKLLLSPQSTPYGNTSAGIYKKKSAETLTECIDACCDDANCNVAFLFNSTCFTIQCHSYELCKPLKRSGKKFEKSFLVTVRLPGEYSTNSESNRTLLLQQSPIAFITDFFLSSRISCRINIGNMCQKVVSYTHVITMMLSSNYTIVSSNAYVKLTVYDTFFCKDSEMSLLEIAFRITGFPVNWFPDKWFHTVVDLQFCYVKYYDELTDTDPGKSFSDILYNDEEDDDPDKDAVLPILDNSGATTAFFSAAPAPSNCVYGLQNDCPVHETCIPKNKRARTGLCHCVENYERDIKGYCKEKRTTAIGSQHITIAPSAGSAMGSSQNKTGTDKSTSTTASPVHHLVVSAGDNVTLQLPENEVTLSAYALKQQEDEGSDGYKYEWALISHPDGDEPGTMEDQNTKNLKLSKLRAGLYTFKVTVSSANAVGEAMVNVTVLPPERENKPPIAIIQPSNVTVKLPNKDTVLDGSFSTDDDKIIKYQWEVLQVPIGYAVQLNETPTLQLKNLIPGLYRFKLTVTDSKGAFNSTFANVTVQKETDYPPTANAKSEVVIYLPQNEVTLNGNLSTDDKGIKSWEWKKSPDTDKAVDMEGTNGPYLHLSQLEVGVYKFILKVTDTADQTSTTEVHLFVKPESNSPPVAVAGPDQKITLPLQSPVILNGSLSKDDIKIAKWKWEQIQGPKPATLKNPNSAVTEVTGFAPGYYQFMLTVYDEKDAHSSATVNVSVIQTENMPPRANAGGDKTIFLPCDVIIMNGSLSSDDIAVVKYEWNRDPASLAAGSVIENSDKSSILKLTNLISGRYLFRLTVYDLQGASSSDTASLIVKPPATLIDQVEIMINADIKSFTQEQEDTLLRQLEILLHDGDPVKVNLIKLDSDRHSRRVVLIFTVERVSSLNSGLISGVDVVSRLKRKLRTDSSLLDVEVLSVDTVVCQNKCSGHGVCDQYSKHCVCEAFWMQDVFRYNFGDKESNCDWSILYVIIVSFTIVVTLAGVLWSIVCCCTRMRFKRPKKRHRYTLLDDYNDREREKEKLFLSSKSQKSSLMMSDSESDAIFESQSVPLNMKMNGLSNGTTRDNHNISA